MTTKSNSITGSCLCGQITVSVNREASEAANSSALCYCKNCRKIGGALASVNMIVPETTVTITGQPKIYQDGNTDSGTPIQRAFCGNCSCPIYSATPTLPGVLIVKCGLFEEIPQASMELYCKTRPSWMKPVDNAKQFETMPPKEA